MEALTRRYEEAETSLKVLREDTKACEAMLADRDLELARAAVEQVAERGFLEVLHCEIGEARGAHAKQVSKANTKLAAREEEARASTHTKAAVDRATFSHVDLRASQALSSMCSLGLESSFIPQGAVYAKFSYELVKELKGAAKKVDSILEEECHDLFSVVATRILSHLLLRDPHFDFEGEMGPVPEESRSDLATVMEGHVHTLLEKFSCDDDEQSREETFTLP
ncbi:hypothetical protein D1007_14254 [Hordeum vulgare]|nr:hypothetical protein D1007_14254 [Hordeum vulgare]